MRESGHFHCQDCGIAFESADAMKDHHRAEHSDQADGGDGTTGPSGPVRSAARNPDSTRKNREFTRGHLE